MAVRRAVVRCGPACWAVEIANLQYHDLAHAQAVAVGGGCPPSARAPGRWPVEAGGQHCRLLREASLKGYTQYSNKRYSRDARKVVLTSNEMQSQ